MDKLNINTLFSPNEVIKKKKVNSPISIKTMFGSKNTSKNKNKFTVDQLIKTQNDRKKEIKKTYFNVYNICLNKIIEANKLYKSDIFFEVPNTLYGNKIYNKDECLTYIVRKLRNNFMDVLKISDNLIFITWVNVKQNKNES